MLLITELPRIPPTGPPAAISPVKPVRKPSKDPKRPQRERPNRKGREHQPARLAGQTAPAPQNSSHPGRPPVLRYILDSHVSPPYRGGVDRSHGQRMSNEIAASPSTHQPSSAHDAVAPDLVRRLKSVEGHVRGIQRMVESDAYCIDILKQIKAVKQALEKVGAITLKTHLETCVSDGLRSEDAADRERVIAEIVEIVNATGKL